MCEFLNYTTEVVLLRPMILPKQVERRSHGQREPKLVAIINAIIIKIMSQGM